MVTALIRFFFPFCFSTLNCGSRMSSFSELSTDLRALLFDRSMVGCSPEADQAFGPIIAAECRQGFDFTLYFEQSLLSIIPSVIILASFPVRFSNVYRSSVKTVPHSLRRVKAVCVSPPSPPQSTFDENVDTHSATDNCSSFCT